MPTTRTIDGQCYFTDLPALVVGGLDVAAGPGAGWYPFPVTLDSFESQALATGAESPAGELVLDLGLTGWHRLYIAHNPALRVWLDGDVGYLELRGDESRVRDHAMPAADMTGRRLHIAPVRESERTLPVTLFYIRARPCDGPPVKHGNLIATNDGHGVLYHGMDKPEDLYRHVAPFAEGDFFRLVWGLYGGAILSMRPDTVGESPLRPHTGDYRDGDYRFSRSLARLQAAGVDPLAVVRRATRDYGLELHYYTRLSAFYGPFPRKTWTSRLYREHPEWRVRNELGEPVTLMSYAYPQVQDRILAFYDELFDYEPEGICLAFNRGLPLMGCEEPVLEAYRRKHGRLPRLPEELDSPELVAVRCELLTDFVARVAQLAERRGREISCIVPRDLEHSRILGLDAEALVARGLVQSVMVGAGHQDPLPLNKDLAPLQALKTLGAAAGVAVYGGGSHVAAHGRAWEAPDLAASAQHMANILDSGLDGGWFWDAESMFPYDWESFRQFGNRSFLNRLIAREVPAIAEHETLAIDGYTVSRWNPWHAY